MKNIIIDYLSTEDYNNLPYKSAEKEIKKYQVIKCNNYDSFKKEIENLKHNEDTILTILSHGHTRGINKGTYETLITWYELLEIVNSLKGNHLLKLNLLAICNSSNMQKTADFCKHEIDEIWFTNNTTFSISKALLALKEINFEDFIDNLDDDEQELYNLIKPL